MERYLESIVNELSRSAFESTLLSSITGLFSLIALRLLTDSLLNMHRSKSARKKIDNQYTFGMQLRLKPAWDHCIHAPMFCRFLICCHHVRFCLCLISLTLGASHHLSPFFAEFHAWFSVALCFLYDTPIWVLNLILDRYPFMRRKHEYRFEKYHNTHERNKLF